MRSQPKAHAFESFKWIPERGRFTYRNKARYPADSNKCFSRRCQNTKAKLGRRCSRCLKAIQFLNDPFQLRIESIRNRAKERGQEFKLTKADLIAMAKRDEVYEAFLYDPSEYHVDRKDCLQGYNVDNCRFLKGNLNLAKSHIEKKIHKYKAQKAQGQTELNLPDFLQENWQPNTNENPF